MALPPLTSATSIKCSEYWHWVCYLFLEESWFSFLFRIAWWKIFEQSSPDFDYVATNPYVEPLEMDLLLCNGSLFCFTTQGWLSLRSPTCVRTFKIFCQFQENKLTKDLSTHSVIKVKRATVQCNKRLM